MLPQEFGGAPPPLRAAQRAHLAVPADPGLGLRGRPGRTLPQPGHRVGAEPGHPGDGTVRQLRVRPQDPLSRRPPVGVRQGQAVRGVRLDGTQERVLGTALEELDLDRLPALQQSGRHAMHPVDHSHRVALDQDRLQRRVDFRQPRDMVRVPPGGSGRISWSQ
ncbi:hypothetical protein LN042_12315 [Kitasatospora sp. RB6PN24]|nr:hypothetical protein [Kitasatospora humi]